MTDSDNRSYDSSVKNTWDKLNSETSDSPQNLILHTQRILFCIDNELSERACAALKDLFLILKNNGQDLKVRMFNLVSPIIENSDRNFFQQYLLEGDFNYLESHQYHGSIFSDKNSENTNN